MGEFLSPQRQVEKFGRDLFYRSFPDVERRGAEFARFLLQFNPPQGFFDRLASASSYMTKDEVVNNLEVMALQVKQKIGTSPYDLLISEPGKSEEWIYINLINFGIRPPEAVFSVTSDASRSADLEVEALNRRPIINPIIFVDDWVISGEQMKGTVERLKESLVPSIFLLAATREGISTVRSGRKVEIEIRTAQDSPIPTLGGTLMPPDIEFLNEMYKRIDPAKDDLEDIGIGNGSVLFASAHKTPDNVPDIFTGVRTFQGQLIPPLIVSVVPPYRKS